MSVYITTDPEPCPHAVRIELDRPNASYQPGEPISGRVVVTPGMAEHCPRLAAELQLHVHGRVNAVAVIEGKPLFQGYLQPGATQSFAFSIEVPRTAGAYYGRGFNSELRLAAILVRPPKSDKLDLMASVIGVSRDELVARAHPAAVAALNIAGDPRPLVVTLDPNAAHARLSNRGRKVVAAIVALLLALGLIGMGVVAALGHLSPAWAFMLGGFGGALIAGVLGAVTLHRHLGAWFAERRIGIPSFALHTTPGSHIDLRVQLQDDSAARVDAALKIIERIEVQDGTGSHFDSEVIHQLPFAMHRSAPGTWVAQLPLSAVAGLPPTVGMPWAQLRWDLEVTIDLPGWPDWTDAVSVDAYPGGDRPVIRTEMGFSFD